MTNMILKKSLSMAVALCVMFTTSIATLIVTAQENITWENKITKELHEVIEKSEKTDKIPVFIWIEDIEQNAVEREVEKRTGLTVDNIPTITEPMGNELATRIEALEKLVDPDVGKDFQEYFTNTEIARIQEQQRVETYISTRREISRSQYNTKNAKFLKDNKISTDNTIFTSNYAPLIVAELTIDEIENTAKQKLTVFIDLYTEPDEDLVPPNDMNLAAIRTSTRINDIHSQLGLSGVGVNIGMIDHGTYANSSNPLKGISYPELPASRFIVLGTPSPEEHPTNCALIVAGTGGVAPGATVRIHWSGKNDADFMASVEALITAGVSLISASRTQGTYSTPISSYPTIAAWTDHVSSAHNVTFLAAVGNGPTWDSYNGYNVIAPANADNVISVTGFDNKETLSTADDVMYDYCYVNGNQASKPDIAVVANIRAGGTSSATPYAAGVVALMMQLRPSLQLRPEAVKAILMASCHYKALPATGTPTEIMTNGITVRQGAGAMNAYRAITITGQGTYGVRTISNSTAPQSIRFLQQGYSSSGMNVSMAWLRTPTMPSNHNNSPTNIGTRHDLRLSVTNGLTTKNGATNTASTRMVYWANPGNVNTNYTINVSKATSGTEIVRFGYAWSVDLTPFQYTQEFEGVYFLKNKQSGHYFSLDSVNSLNTSQTVYSGVSIQRWVVRKSGSTYQLQSAYNSVGSISRGSLINGNFYSAVVTPTSPAGLNIVSHADGSVSLTHTVSGSTSALCTNGNSSSSSAAGAWQTYSSSNDNQKWYLERISYHKGDLNQDGAINSTDSALLTNYLSQPNSFNTLQLYLADVNGDGIVNIADNVLLAKIVNGQF